MQSGLRAPPSFDAAGGATSTWRASERDVGLPRSLPELQHFAAQQLLTGRTPRSFKFYANGHEITHAKGFDNHVANGATIVVKPNNQPQRPPVEPVCSTHKADFVGAAAPPAVPIIASKGASVMDQVSKGKFFETRSQSHADYVHIPSPRVKPVGAHRMTSIRTFDTDRSYTTSYGSHYKYPPAAEGVQETIRNKESVISNSTLGKGFDAVSGYKEEYGRPRGWKIPLPEKPANLSDTASTLTDAVMAKPFEGQSTYDTHYAHFGGKAEKRASARPAREMPRPQPFSDETEYRTMFQDTRADHGLVLKMRFVE